MYFSSVCSGYGLLAVCAEHGIETLRSVKGRSFLDYAYMNDYQLYSRVSHACVILIYIGTCFQCVFDDNCCMRKFESVEPILKEFFKVRLAFYVKRKDYLEGMLQAESRKLSNQAR
jgi:hypothetical protein